jgi:beta-phosphoglucomutase-like phosphatase (HAD superfamily)
VAVEDSLNGIRSAKAAGMRCIAVPNTHYPPGDALSEADAVVVSVRELTPEILDPGFSRERRAGTLAE